ncbi:hypothetical protein A2803_02875 [Candidatus Woesebacteria bacterium RIFCSPHIGHO2_01_FULL_44_21]|uniref:Uncharacterized protein n=1 Tax=Candidatus Woesebacteria bacterium RIFCSPHIGHO2_01_FULL_44_21 TaxID=1802503 RepID=A0A1F7YYQ3_9BACT|nr:MAG: hypothetical protein A2803_02875 [Candidatus Woesebacteria bacterium RIFCSPHIGHO2_01_FULL_44_21]
MLAITSAVYQFASEHDGNLPATTYALGVGQDFPVCDDPAGVDATEIGGAALQFDMAAAGDCDLAVPVGSTCDANGDGTADAELTVPTYLTEVPSDPSTGAYATGTDYVICVMSDTTPTPGRVYAAATDELGTVVGNFDINVLR